MYKLFLLACILSVSSYDPYKEIVCKPSGFECIGPNQYQLCQNILGRDTLIPQVETCGNGKICDDFKFSPCTYGTPSKKYNQVEDPKCNGSGNIPAADCHQYYECVRHWLFWRKPVLRSCAKDESFNPESKICEYGPNCALEKYSAGWKGVKTRPGTKSNYDNEYVTSIY